MIPNGTIMMMGSAQPVPTASITNGMATNITGIIIGNGATIGAAVAGTDYSAGTSALATGIVKSTTGTGALSIATSGTDYSAGTSALASGIVTSTTGTGILATVTAPTGTIVGTSDTQTITNKRLTKRVVTVTQAATPTINTDNTDIASITGLAQAITSMTTNLSGTPVNGDMLLVSITDNGTARAITWGASFEASTVALPTTTVISTRLDTLFIWNTATSKWRCIGVA